MLSVSGSALLAFRSTQTAAKRLGSAAGSIRSNAGKSTRTASPKPASPLVRKWLQSYHTSSSLKFEDGDFATKGTRQSKISSEEMSDLLKGITGRPKATQSEPTEQSGWGYSSRASSSRGDSSERAYTSAGYSGSKSSRFGGSSEYSRPRKSFNDDYEDAAPSSKPRGGNDAWDEPQSADRASDRSASRGDRYGSDRYGGSRDGGDGFRGNRYGGARESSGDRFGSSFSGDRFGRSSGSGYGSSYGGGGSRGMAPRGDLGSRLKRKDFTEENLPPVAKNFYKESESVTAMTEEEVKAFRHLHDMEVIGEGCPRPVLNFAQTSFPVFIQKQLEKAFPKGPSHIQSQGWPLSSSGRDVVASAQTGSGKTLAFVLPALEHVAGQPKLAAGEPGADEPVALFLAPTRELAMQIHEETRRFANFYGFKTACVYGGAQNRIEQQRQLLNRPQVIIATPGRLIDFVESGAVRLGRISYVVLDEADRMLDMGFEPQVRSIMDQIRPDRQTLMWSATWPKRVQQLADSFLKNPIRIKIGSDEISANKNVTQTFAFTNWNDRLDRLVDEMQARKGQKILIFVSKKANAELLADELYDRGHRVQALHGDKPQSARTRILDDFKTGRASILIATDVAARGIDVSDIQVVINYNMPLNSEDYVHRIGRTGRAGRKGTSISFFSETDEILVPELITILEESGQEVPAEFRDVIEKRRAERAASLRSGGGYKRSSSRPRSYGGRPRSYSRR